MSEEIKDAEFRGLFLGEGYISIVRIKRYPKGKIVFNYRPQLSLSQRLDNRQMIDWIKNRYGGHIWIAKNIKSRFVGINMSQAAFWTTTNSHEALKICKILEKSSIPSKKLTDVKLVKRYCEWKVKMAKRKNTPKEKQFCEKIYQLCKENHKFGNGVTL